MFLLRNEREIGACLNNNNNNNLFPFVHCHVDFTFIMVFITAYAVLSCSKGGHSLELLFVR